MGPEYLQVGALKAAVPLPEEAGRGGVSYKVDLASTALLGLSPCVLPVWLCRAWGPTWPQVNLCPRCPT